MNNVHELLSNHTLPNAWLETEFSNRAMLMQRNNSPYTDRDLGGENLDPGMERYFGKTAVCRVLGRYLMEILPDDIGCSTHLAMNGYWELPVTRAMAKHVPYGSKCIDVGANVGYFTVLLAGAMGCEVQAWEPQFRLYEPLRRTLAMNGLERLVQLIPAVAHSGSAEMKVCYDEDTGNASCHLNTSVSEETVLGTSIDLQMVDHVVDFVKIDVEGHEPDVIDGMKKVIEASPKLQICMEFTPRLYDDAGAFLYRLSEQFEVLSINDDGSLRRADCPKVLAVEEFEMIWLRRNG
jgi:FkbM family methyltransferase